MASIPRGTVRARIISVVNSGKITPHAVVKVSMRTPPGVISNEVNPLKRLAKTQEVTPKEPKNLAKFAG